MKLWFALLLLALAAILSGCARRSDAAVLQCGTARHAEKVMADEQAPVVNLVPIEATIEELGNLPEPDPPVRGNEARGIPGEAEFRVYTTEGHVFDARREDDQDVHLALTDGDGHHLLVEAVHPRCAEGSIARADIAAVRVDVFRAARLAITDESLHQGLVGKRVRVTGVGFFDRPHRQTGAAKNGFELHPLLALEVLP